MIDVFSRYLFAYPVQNMTAHTVGRCIKDVMTRHAYLPTCIISDKGSQFRAEVIQEITNVLDIEVRHATTKHVQTIGILERTHASLKTSLKISTGETKSMWHIYVKIVVMNYNTTNSRNYTPLHQPPKRFRNTSLEADVDLDVRCATREGLFIPPKESKGLSTLLSPSPQTLSSSELDDRNSVQPKKANTTISDLPKK